VNTVARLLPGIGAVVISGVFAADPPPHPAAAAPSQTVAESPAVAPTGASTTAEAQPVANKPGRKVLVDDTVTDAQLKQILGKGYRPASQARANEVYYCRSERELGSRIETKVCKTAAQIFLDEQRGKDATTDVERDNGNKALGTHERSK
jgi:hypothetical protein